jgi:protoheme IX farnesyltransferase
VRKAWFLFTILFLWQFPHFLAIALMYREDYARARYKCPELDRDSRFTRAEILTLTLILIFVTMLVPSGSGSALYVGGALLAGSFFLYYVVRLARSSSRVLASRVLHAFVLYLPIILGWIVAMKR